MASVYDVANWFLTKDSLTPKKIQKLTYYYYAWGFALYEEPMIENCDFKAWVHGPVNSDLYDKYRKYRWNYIPKYEGKTYEFNEKEQELLESVWLTYGDKSANELEALTHKEAPWIKARNGIDDSELSNNIISPEDMKNYYYSIYAGEQGD
ncbi:Panacea domain-containing protein [Helcococcus sueciensis]|uniref:Panacea domain-containing protein n=1 Tax=Helcococcus sueciensis TaxID=241555 RepID=UPI000417BFB7|nr:type II toxin-antitoxin system antitoxin SocA domain-containing protein [Helcococcus sueciensis]